MLESVMTVEAESQNSMSRIKPCFPLKKSCNKTSDCCTGYCSVSEDKEGFCYDPLVLSRDSGIRPGFPELMEFSSMKKSRGQQHPFPPSSSSTQSTLSSPPDYNIMSLASNLSPSSTTHVASNKDVSKKQSWMYSIHVISISAPS